jgi:polyisoprenoid-binding protein YceI
MHGWHPKNWWRSALSIGVVAWLAAALPASAASRYSIDQRYGTVEFSVGILGLFTTQGRFPRFEGDLLLDVEHPERSHIDVSIDANAVEMPLQDQVELLRSAAYFDTAQHPTERFASTAIQALSPAHYVIHGTLRIRGVTQPQDLDAILQDRHIDQAQKVEVADFVVTGQIRRSAFGMVADRTMISDTVQLAIRIHLMVGLAPDDH